MDNFCNTVIHYIKKDFSHNEIIAFTMRDVFLNDLIYVEYVDKWKQYETDSKKWKEFISTDFSIKLEKLSDFFKNELWNYIKINYKEIEQFYLKRELQTIQKIIVNDIYIKEIFELCKNLFSIGI